MYFVNHSQNLLQNIHVYAYRCIHTCINVHMRFCLGSGTRYRRPCLDSPHCYTCRGRHGTNQTRVSTLVPEDSGRFHQGSFLYRI